MASKESVNIGSEFIKAVGQILLNGIVSMLIGSFVGLGLALAFKKAKLHEHTSETKGMLKNFLFLQNFLFSQNFIFLQNFINLQ